MMLAYNTCLESQLIDILLDNTYNTQEIYHSNFYQLDKYGLNFHMLFHNQISMCK